MQDSPAAVNMFDYRERTTVIGPADKSPKACHGSFTVGLPRAAFLCHDMPLRYALLATQAKGCRPFTNVTHSEEARVRMILGNCRLPEGLTASKRQTGTRFSSIDCCADHERP